MDEPTMKQLWLFNKRYSNTTREARPTKRKEKHEKYWGGYRTRVMLHALYTVSMLCLLRYDEALRIMWSDIEFVEIDGQNAITLNLPFRKTHQTGSECKAHRLILQDFSSEFYLLIRHCTIHSLRRHGTAMDERSRCFSRMVDCQRGDGVTAVWVRLSLASLW